MLTFILVLNLAASFASAAFAAVALVRPASLSGSTHIERGEVFYARMYAARSIPFGLAAGLLPFRCSGKAMAWGLFTAAFIQTADAVIGALKKDRGMAVGAAMGALVHILCGIALL